jgi:hypothetical protein
MDTVYFQDRPERDEFPLEFLSVFLLQARGVLMNIHGISPHILSQILDGIGGPSNILSQDLAEPGINKMAGFHHIRDVCFPHPSEPILLYFQVDIDRDIIQNMHGLEGRASIKVLPKPLIILIFKNQNASDG